MIRHYNQIKLKNSNPAQRLNVPSTTSIWKLSPYEVAQFSGELIQVMANAAQHYIYEKSSSVIKKEFQQEILKNKNPS